MNYYNEHDPFAAAWLRRLIDAGLIPAGDVDERSIEDVTPNDVAIYTSCHWFAGIGGWPYALRLAGWPDDRPVWTGSAPCQPFSQAGKGSEFADERHLWPVWFWLIRQCRPATIFGEQVSSAAGLDWFATVSSDLEAAGYAVGAADLCAAGVGAPHIRQRLYFVADADKQQWNGGGQSGQGRRRQFANGGSLDNPGGAPHIRQRLYFVADADRASAARQRKHGRQSEAEKRIRRGLATGGSLGNPGDLRNVGFWSDLEWLPCLDGKARPTQPGLFPLAHGVPARVGRLRGYGNAIVPPLAAEFIKAYQEAR